MAWRAWQRRGVIASNGRVRAGCRLRLRSLERGAGGRLRQRGRCCRLRGLAQAAQLSLQLLDFLVGPIDLRPRRDVQRLAGDRDDALLLQPWEKRRASPHQLRRGLQRIGRLHRGMHRLVEHARPQAHQLQQRVHRFAARAHRPKVVQHEVVALGHGCNHDAHVLRLRLLLAERGGCQFACRALQQLARRRRVRRSGVGQAAIGTFEIERQGRERLAEHRRRRARQAPRIRHHGLRGSEAGRHRAQRIRDALQLPAHRVLQRDECLAQESGFRQEQLACR